MAINTTLAGLSTNAAANGPDGTIDPPSSIDDALRYALSFIAMLRDTAVPVGGIIIWSGSLLTLPTNWALCDGTLGTPDLRSRFVVGAGGRFAVNAAGGSANAVVVSHNHAFSGATGSEDATHSHNVGDPGHSHANRGQTIQGDTAFSPSALTDGGTRPVGFSTQIATTGITLSTQTANHKHFYSGNTTSTGVPDPADTNMPPYLALAYIMRIA